ncbi:MAG TPA: type IX secretion system sortase PorU [Tenuifilaceae bacterium]|nr:type IX secretion system sortase PorU [Tenuifilaceae bacterium]
MHNQKQILTFFFILIIAHLGYGQDTLSRTIKWNIPSEISSKKTPSFNGAVFQDATDNVPCYFELIPITGPENQIKIVDKVWQTYTETDEKVQKDTTALISISKSRGKNFAQVTIPALRVKNNEVQLLRKFNILVYTNTESKGISNLKENKKNSVLSSGTWVKVSVTKSGIYKINYNELETYGLTNLSNVSIWGNGGKTLPYYNYELSPDDLNPIPTYIYKGTDGIFNSNDYILFYAEGPDTYTYNATNDIWEYKHHNYSNTISYFITTDYPQTLIQEKSYLNSTPTYTTNQYDAFYTYEPNDTNLIESGREWFGDIFDLTTQRTYSTNFSNPVSGTTGKVLVRAAARADVSSNFSIQVNGTQVGTISLNAVSIGDELADVVSVKEQLFTFTQNSSPTEVKLTYSKPNSAAIGFLDYVTVNSRQQLKYNNNQLIFRDLQSKEVGKISNFTIDNATSNLQVWDISNINNSMLIKSQYSDSKLTFNVPTDSIRHFIAFDPDKALSVTFEEQVANQNIHGITNPEFIIVTHPNFTAQAEEIANLHAEYDGLNVTVVTTNQVYNEFSSGNRDVSAIRNMMRYFYNISATTSNSPKYLLLIGDGSYNNLSQDATNSNFVPTYQSARSINNTGSFVSDDYFGLLDENEGEASGLLDIGIGRFPVNTTEQAETVVSKVRKYLSYTDSGDWQSKLCFIGDDEDANVHMEDANTLAEYISTNHNEYNISKIFFDAYTQVATAGGESYPDVTKAINSAINNGLLLVNYTGHGNERWLAHEKVVMLDDILSWENSPMLPLFITATCEFSRFDNYHMTSSGEWVLLSPKGGAIALLSTTRLVYSSPNFVLNYNFIQNAFNKDSTGKHYRLGDLIRISKNLSGSGNNKRNFSLLGDPALMLRYPSYNAVLQTVNDKPVTDNDTISALDKVILTGNIEDENNQLVSNYNGVATVTVYDKKSEITTLANNGGTPMTFYCRDNIIYKGEANVTNGEFSLEFVVPKDINMAFGDGRVSIFATNSSTSALGSNESVIVGGVSDNPTTDNTGPEISIYFNDTLFTGNGITDSNPMLLVKLFDENGINTTGIGIGHDITATLTSPDGETNYFVLNPYYKANTNDFKVGFADYQLTNLTPGTYQLYLKAWDVYNNSSEKTIRFNVTGNNFVIKNFYNYPNPFTNGTSIYFEHNRPDKELTAKVQVYDISGRLVKDFTPTTVNNGGYRVGPIFWNGTGNNGSKLPRGIYIGLLKVTTGDGESAQCRQKFVLSK